MNIYNLKLAVRSLLKNKMFTVLNIIGFALGFSVCIIIGLFAYKEYTVDNAFPESKNTYRIIDTKCNTSRIDNTVVPILKDRYPEIKEIIPVFYMQMSNISGSYIKRLDNKEYIQVKDIINTNDDFFNFFGIKTIVKKSSHPFDNNKSIILSKSVATKLFGRTDIIGQIVQYSTEKFPVSAVVEDIPHNSSIAADIYIHQNNPDYVMGMNCPEAGCYAYRDIYIKLSKGVNVKDFAKRLSLTFPENRTHTKAITLQPLTSIYLDKSITTNERELMKFDNNKKGNSLLIIIFISVALLTIVMSAFNYMSFAISRQLTTLKTSSIKIANGANIIQVKSYYFIEATILIIISLFVGVIISSIFLPYVERLLHVRLDFDWFLAPQLVTSLVVLTIVIIILSVFIPLRINSGIWFTYLRGKHDLKLSKLHINKVMTVAQLLIAMVLLMSLMSINKQLYYVKTKDIGFRKEHLICIDLPYELREKSVFQDEILALPFVESACFTSSTPGNGWHDWGIKAENEEEVMIRTVFIDKDFLKTFGLKLIEGRELMDSDTNKSCYVTENTLKALGWKNYIGKKYENYDVVGVVKNTNYNSLHTEIIPVGFVCRSEHLKNINIRLKKGDTKAQLIALKKTWDETTSHEPFNMKFYDEYFDSLYQKETHQSKALTLFSVLAFMITCLGLFGQIFLATEKRIKEIGIRKINGANIKEVMTMLNKQFIYMVAIAFVIATPFSYFTMHKWLQNFAYKTALSWWIFALAGLIALAIALLTVSWQSWKAATRNPVEALRYE